MPGPDDRYARGASPVRPPVHRVFIAQFVVLLLVFGITACLRLDLAVSLFLGGLIHLIPNMFFARQVFRFSGAKAAHRVTQAFYRGELGKFILTATGFALVFSLVKTVNPAALFAGFGVMLVSHAVLVARLSRE